MIVNLKFKQNIMTEEEINKIEYEFESRLIATKDLELIEGYTKLKSILSNTIELLLDALDQQNGETK
jgi:hypothetical protein